MNLNMLFAKCGFSKKYIENVVNNVLLDEPYLDKIGPMAEDLYRMDYLSPNKAFIISLFLGALGIDRFYIGDTGLGIVKLFTLGGFGAWAFIDLFRIKNLTRKKNLNKICFLLGN